MRSASIPGDEESRLAALYEYGILDTEAEPAYDRITRLLCSLFSAPIATVTFVDRNRQWFKAARGLNDCQTPRNISFCGHVVYSGKPLIVEDALADERFYDNPLVVNEPYIRFYAGVPLTTAPQGHHIGVLTVQDTRPRGCDNEALANLQDLALLVMDELDLRLKTRQHERELTRFRLIAETIQDAFWLRTPERTLYVNPVYEQLWGRPVEGFYADPNSFLDGVHPDDRQQVEEALSNALAENVELDLLYRIVRPDGSIRWVQSHSRPVSGAEDEMLRAGIARDVTDLQKALLELQAANRAKTDFLNAVSHDMRTPLNAIIGFTELLADSPLDANQQRQIELCRSAGSTLLGLIDTLLDLSCLEEGRIELQQEPFALRDFLSRQMALLSGQAEEKGLSLEWSVDDDVPERVYGDVIRFGQVLFNLLINAIKFTPRGYVRLRLSRSSERYVQVAVEDSGPGISAEIQQQIFQPFERGQVQGYDFHGSGLGLAISRELTSLMGGEMRLESTQGEGSTFLFTAELPPLDDETPERLGQKQSGQERSGQKQSRQERSGQKQSRQERSGQERSGKERSGQTAQAKNRQGNKGDETEQEARAGFAERTGQGGELDCKGGKSGSISASQGAIAGMRVLVAEDEATNALLIREMLARCAAQVTEASDGQEAFAAWQKAEEGFDLILLDMQMPVLDGAQAARALRESEAEQGLRRTPIVVLSAHTTDEVREQCLHSGADTYLVKPIRLDDLTQVLVWAHQQVTG